MLDQLRGVCLGTGIPAHGIASTRKLVYHESTFPTTLRQDDAVENPGAYLTQTRVLQQWFAQGGDLGQASSSLLVVRCSTMAPLPSFRLSTR